MSQPTGNILGRYSHTIHWLLAIIALTGLLWLNHHRQTPAPDGGDFLTRHGFSLSQAFSHIDELAYEPRTNGSNAHKSSRAYLVQQLSQLGLETQIQKILVTDAATGRAQTVHNIIARLKASSPTGTKALLLMAHYDSVSRSPGAADDASGVAVILESLRSWLTTKPQPARDILVLISDGEEHGLLGAKGFLHHPWLSRIGLVINLEARGSGGPAYLLLETRHGNQAMLKLLQAASLPRPSTSSLAYSIYKLLPNDTDLSVFRTHNQGIDGYNIAFIGDPFDYHTALDTPARLDRESVAHQAEYLLSLLHFFATAPNLDTRSKTDAIFFSIPLWQGIIDFPAGFSPWLALVTWLSALLALFWSRKKLGTPWRLLGSAALLQVQALVISLVLGRYGWLAVQAAVPYLADMSLGYPYSGVYWQSFFVLFSLCITLALWRRWLTQTGTSNTQQQFLAAALAVSVLTWLILLQIVVPVLPGAAFLWMVPLSQAILLLALSRNTLNALLWLAVSLLPALVLLPLIEQLPVALGLNALFAVTALVALITPALLPALCGLSTTAGKYLLRALCLIAAVVFIQAAWQTRISTERPQQNSLFYLQDNDNQRAWWISFDAAQDDWKRDIMGDKHVPEKNHPEIDTRLVPWIKQAATAPYHGLPGFTVVQSRWELRTATRHYLFVRLQPQRKIKRLDFVAGQALQLHTLRVNGQGFDSNPTYKAGQTVLRYWFDDIEAVDIELEFSSEKMLSFLLYALSPDLLQTDNLSVPPRPATLIGRPTELTDALLTRQTLVRNGASAAIATTQSAETPTVPQTKP